MARRKRRSKSKSKSGPRGANVVGNVDTGWNWNADRARPWLAGAVCMLFVTQPLVTSESNVARGDGLPGVMFWIGLAIFWLFGAIRQKHCTVRFGWPDIAVVALIGWHTIAALVAARHGSPRPAVNAIWLWGGFGLSFLLARQLLVGRREIRAMLVVMVAVAVALSGYAVYQRFVEMPASWKIYGNDPVGTMQAAGIDAEPGSSDAMLFEKRLFSFEPLGTFALTNSLAGYLAPWLVVAVGIGLGIGLPGNSPKRNGEKAGLPGRKRLVATLGAAISAVAIGVCLAWTKSRSAYVAVLVGLPVAYWLCRTTKIANRGKLLVGVLTAAGLLAGAAVAMGSLDRKILSQASLSLSYRMQYWQSSLAMIGEHPIVGCGPGQFQSAYTAYKLPEASEEIADPHNFLIEVWATAGTPALVALVALLGCFAWTSFSRRERAISNGPFDTSELSEKFESPKNQSPEKSPSTRAPDAVFHLLGGAVLGFLIAFPFGLANSAPTSAIAILLGLPLAGIVMWALFPWIEHARLPARLPLAGVIVLLIHLLAAGGIGFSGVCGTFWLLLALGLNASCREPSVHRMSQKTTLLLLVTALAMAGTCYVSAYGPVLECRWRMDLAESLTKSDLVEAEELLVAAAAADSLAAEPWNKLAGLALFHWHQNPDPKTLARFERYDREFIRRMPNSASAHAVAAERQFIVFEQSGQESALASAVRLYTRAVRLYPHHATHRAKLALALQAAGDRPGFEREAARALELDVITPHVDQKLSDEHRTALQRNYFPEK